MNNILYNIQKILSTQKISFNKFDLNILESLLKKQTLTDKNIKTIMNIYNRYKIQQQFQKNKSSEINDDDFFIKLSKSISSDLKVDGLQRDLFPFQNVSIEYSTYKNSFFICDQMGTGKTTQSISILHYHHAYPGIIICPGMLKKNWEKELKTILPTNINIQVLKGGKTNIKNSTDIFLCNYDIIKNYADIFITLKREKPKKNQKKGKILERINNFNFKSIILDESHYIKNKKAQRTQCIIDYFFDIERKICLTGTPILNNPIELVSQLSFLGVIEELFGSEWSFIKRFCDPKHNGFGFTYGSSNEDMLQFILRKNCLVRREKKDVLKQLPPKTKQVISLQLENYGKYLEYEKNPILWYIDLYEKENKFTSQNEKNYILSNLENIKNICEIIYSKYKEIQLIEEEEIKNKKLEKKDKTNRIEFFKNELNKINTTEPCKEIMLRLLKLSAAPHLTRIEILKQASSHLKLNNVFQWIDNVLLQSPKLVIFAHHEEIVKKIAERYKNECLYLVGGMSNKAGKYVEQFQTDPKIKLFIGSIQAVSVGITLTAADKLAFIELGWSPSIHEQAEDRIHRIGQLNPANIYYLIGEGTIEEDIYDLILSKDKIITKTLSFDEILDILNKKINNRKKSKR